MDAGEDRQRARVVGACREQTLRDVPGGRELARGEERLGAGERDFERRDLEGETKGRGERADRLRRPAGTAC
jgi:hypothetical protein